MSLSQRMKRLEQRAGLAGSELRLLVLRGFQGDGRAMWYVARRIRRAMLAAAAKVGAHHPEYHRAVHEADPELGAALAALPPELKTAALNQAEHQHGLPLAELETRLRDRLRELAESGGAGSLSASP